MLKTLFVLSLLPALALSADAQFRVQCTNKQGQKAFEGEGKLSFPKKGGVKIKYQNGNEYLIRDIKTCTITRLKQVIGEEDL